MCSECSYSAPKPRNILRRTYADVFFWPRARDVTIIVTNEDSREPTSQSRLGPKPPQTTDLTDQIFMTENNHTQRVALFHRTHQIIPLTPSNNLLWLTHNKFLLCCVLYCIALHYQSSLVELGQTHSKWGDQLTWLSWKTSHCNKVLRNIQIKGIVLFVSRQVTLNHAQCDWSRYGVLHRMFIESYHATFDSQLKLKYSLLVLLAHRMTLLQRLECGNVAVHKSLSVSLRRWAGI